MCDRGAITRRYRPGCHRHVLRSVIGFGGNLVRFCIGHRGRRAPVACHPKSRLGRPAIEYSRRFSSPAHTGTGAPSKPVESSPTGAKTRCYLPSPSKQAVASDGRPRRGVGAKRIFSDTCLYGRAPPGPDVPLAIFKQASMPPSPRRSFSPTATGPASESESPCAVPAHTFASRSQQSQYLTLPPRSCSAPRTIVPCREKEGERNTPPPAVATHILVRADLAVGH